MLSTKRHSIKLTADSAVPGVDQAGGPKVAPIGRTWSHACGHGKAARTLKKESYLVAARSSTQLRRKEQWTGEQSTDFGPWGRIVLQPY